MISLNRKSGILRKAHVLTISRRSLDRHLKEVGEARGLENIQKEIALIGDEELLTFQEVAKLLKYTYSTIHRLAIIEGKLPYRRILGKALRIHASDLKRVINESEYYQGQEEA